MITGITATKYKNSGEKEMLFRGSQFVQDM
jgi:hypothetical protein